jgi:hypothetical protein
MKGGVPFIHNFGVENTFIGKSAGNLTMIGNANTASGYAALSNNNTGNYNTASGRGALASNTTGTTNTATGFSALATNTMGHANTATGSYALVSNTVGISNTAIGAGADVLGGNLSNATAIGAGAVVDASNKVRVGNAGVTVIEGQVGFTSSSDRKKKENLRPVAGEEVLRKVGELSLTSWNFIGHDPKQFRHYGPMAQDFFAAFGHDGIGTIGTETTITSTDMDGILMIAAQALEKRTVEQEKRTVEQKKEIQALRGENADLRARLENENADLKARLAALERKVGNSALAKAE